MPQFLATRDWFARLHDQGNGVPYGIALAIAGLIVYPDTAIWQAALASLGRCAKRISIWIEAVNHNLTFG